MENDPRIDQMLAIAKDTNRVVHKMRRSMLWGRVFTVVVWIVVIFGPVAAYYLYFQHYVQPYMDKMQQFQTQLQTSSAQAQSFQSEISSFFGNLMQHSSTTSTTTGH